MKIAAIALAFATVGCTSAIAVNQNSLGSGSSPLEIRAGRYELDSSHGKITWSVDHLGFSTYVGQFTAVEAELGLDPANPALSTLSASVATRSIGTLNDALDTHLRSEDFLDVERYPEASFVSTGIRTTE